jgi:hypothetical protein
VGDGHWIDDRGHGADPGTRGGRRHLLGLGAVVVGLAALALVLLVLASRPPASFAPGTPESAFQAYLAAWDARDLDGAYAMFSARVHASLTLEAYRSMARGYEYADGAERRVVLVAATTRADGTTLELRIDELGGGGLFGTQSVWSHELTVDLIEEQGGWRVDQAFAGLEPLYWLEK